MEQIDKQILILLGTLILMLWLSLWLQGCGAVTVRTIEIEQAGSLRVESLDSGNQQNYGQTQVDVTVGG